MNITEDYCSFEVAKLLKEKGFDLHDTKELYVAYKDGYCVINNPRTKHYPTDEFPKATHQMTLKWLREIHNIEVNISMSALNSDGSREYMFDVFFTNERYLESSKTKAGFKCYEEAAEAAIKYCLTNLI